MTDSQKFIEWLSSHPCSERELWLLQNMLGTVYGFESEIGQAAGQTWKRRRIDDLKTENKKPFRCRIGWHSVVLTEGNDNDLLHVLMYGYCKKCGMKGMIDSQGNLF